MDDLIYLYSHIDILLVIFCRITAIIVFLPIIQEAKLPKMAISGLCLCLSAIVFMVTEVEGITYADNLISYTCILIKEVITGLIIGFTLKIYFQIYQFIGTLWSTQGGLSMSMALDPVGGAQAPIIGRFYNLAFTLLFVLGGGYQWFIKTLVDSFEAIPINKAIIGANIVHGTVSTIENYIIISFKLAMPLLGILILVDFGLGVLARAVPQMNMFVVGIPMKIIILFILLIVTISLFTVFSDIIIDQMVQTIMSLIKGMTPL